MALEIEIPAWIVAILIVYVALRNYHKGILDPTAQTITLLIFALAVAIAPGRVIQTIGIQKSNVILEGKLEKTEAQLGSAEFKISELSQIADKDEVIITSLKANLDYLLSDIRDYVPR